MVHPRQSLTAGLWWRDLQLVQFLEYVYLLEHCDTEPFDFCTTYLDMYDIFTLYISMCSYTQDIRASEWWCVCTVHPRHTCQSPDHHRHLSVLLLISGSQHCQAAVNWRLRLYLADITALNLSLCLRLYLAAMTSLSLCLRLYLAVIASLSLCLRLYLAAMTSLSLCLHLYLAATISSKTALSLCWRLRLYLAATISSETALSRRLRLYLAALTSLSRRVVTMTSSETLPRRHSLSHLQQQQHT